MGYNLEWRKIWVSGPFRKYSFEPTVKSQFQCNGIVFRSSRLRDLRDPVWWVGDGASIAASSVRPSFRLKCLLCLPVSMRFNTCFKGHIRYFFLHENFTKSLILLRSLPESSGILPTFKNVDSGFVSSFHPRISPQTMMSVALWGLIEPLASYFLDNLCSEVFISIPFLSFTSTPFSCLCPQPHP